VEQVPAGAENIDGRDLFHIYIAEAGADSHFSIARVPDPDTEGPRPMEPFGGGISIHAFDIQEGEFADFTVGPGEVLIGGLTDGEDDLANRPIIQEAFAGGGILGAPGNGQLTAGVVVENGQDFGHLMIGGTVIGEVTIQGSIDTFYVGGLATGFADGERGIGPVSNPNNFFVAGDMRNLFVGGSIGTSDDAAGQLNEPSYLTGFDAEIRGAVGQIHARASISGSGLILNDPSAPRLRYSISEMEVRFNRLPRGSFTDFENFQFGDETDNDNMFVNDDQNRAQYVGTIANHRTLGRNAIVINGQIQRTTLILDFSDHYAFGLMAGQQVSVRLNAAIRFNLNVGIFDPDGRLIASDYGATGQRDLARQGGVLQFVARRPGTYRVAVAGANEADFLEGGEFDPAQLPGIVPYQLQILGVAGDNPDGLGLGGLVAVDGDNLIYDGRFGSPGGGTPVGWRVARGDFGAVDADLAIMSESAGTFTVDEGNLRGVESATIGRLRGNLFESGIDLIVPIGGIGLLRGTDAAGVTYINKNIQLASDQIPPDVEFFGPQSVGTDYQTIDAAGLFYGNIVANRRIGVVRAGSMTTLVASVFAANDDNFGDDGIIDLIDCAGDFGTLAAGGPQISAGDGGNVRYIRVGGTAFRDALFGGGEPEDIISTAGQPVDLVDDSGTPFRIAPYPLTTRRNPVTGRIEFVNPPALTVLTLPVRRGRSGAGGGGVVTLSVTTTGGARVIANGEGRRSSAEIGIINASGGAGTQVVVDRNSIVGRVDTNPDDDFLRLATGPGGVGLGGTDLSILIGGNATVDVLELTHTDDGDAAVEGRFVNIINNTPLGEIVSINAESIGLLSAANIGLPKSHTGFGNANNLNGTSVGLTEVNPINTFSAPGTVRNIFPFSDQRYGIYSTVIAEIRASQALGNIVVRPAGDPAATFPVLLQPDGSIGRIIANFDGVNDAGVHEGINAPIYASGQLRFVQIGEGLLPSGTGRFSHAGIYANDQILRVVNGGMGSDIRGDVISSNIIREIALGDGSIIGADVMVINDGDTTSTGLDFESSSELPIPGFIINVPDTLDNPTFQIQRVVLNGVGGITGASFAADDIGDIIVRGGFGMFQTLLRTLGDGVIDNVSVDGYGVRGSSIAGGAQVNLVNAFGSRSYPTTNFTPSVRLSEKVAIDPYFLTKPDVLTDLHRNLGTTALMPRNGRPSMGGTVDDSSFAVSRTIGTVTSKAIRRSMFNAGNDIRDITAHDYIDGLIMTSGNLGQVAVGTDVVRSSWSASGRIDRVIVRGSIRGSNSIRATGPNGNIGLIQTGRSLYGHVFANVDIERIVVGTELASPNRTIGRATFAGIQANRDLRELSVAGDVFPTARVHVLDDLFQLNVGGDVQEGAIIRIDDQLIDSVIRGQVFGDIIIGNP
jgi:predicted RNA-binding protein with TRAM domain